VEFKHDVSDDDEITSGSQIGSNGGGQVAIIYTSDDSALWETDTDTEGEGEGEEEVEMEFGGERKYDDDCGLEMPAELYCAPEIVKSPRQMMCRRVCYPNPSCPKAPMMAHIGEQMVPTLEPDDVDQHIERAFTEEFPKDSAESIGGHFSYDRDADVVTISYTYGYVESPQRVAKCAQYDSQRMAVMLNVPQQVIFRAALEKLRHRTQGSQPGLWRTLQSRAKAAGFRHVARPKVKYAYSNFPYHITASLPGCAHKETMGAGHHYDLLLDPFNFSMRNEVQVALSQRTREYTDDDVQLLKQMSDPQLDKILIPSKAHDGDMVHLWYHEPMGLMLRDYAVKHDLAGQRRNLSFRENHNTTELNVRMHPQDAGNLRVEVQRRRDACLPTRSLPLMLNCVLQPGGRCPCRWYMRKYNDGGMYEQKRKFAMTVEFKLKLFV